MCLSINSSFIYYCYRRNIEDSCVEPSSDETFQQCLGYNKHDSNILAPSSIAITKTNPFELNPEFNDWWVSALLDLE